MSQAQVLFVDDDVWLLDQMERYVQESLGCVTLRATNGVAAMELLDTQRPQAIVLDMFMPGPNGIVLLHELQSHHDLGSVPVILCTNNAASMKLDELTPYGVVALLDKGTMVPEDVVVALRKVLP